jgi:hypothetical protein
MTTTPRLSAQPQIRSAGACGMASAALILAAPSFTGTAATTIWIAGYVLLLPFFAGVATLVRAAGGRAAWLSPVIPAAAALLVALQLVQFAVEDTANHMSTSSPVHEPLHDVGAALFVLGILPFGIALVATAVVGLVDRAMPRWLAGSGAVIGLIALVNGTMLGSESAWGLLLSLVWVLAAGITLTVRRRNPFAPEAQLAAAAG